MYEIARLRVVLLPSLNEDFNVSLLNWQVECCGLGKEGVHHDSYEEVQEDLRDKDLIADIVEDCKGRPTAFSFAALALNGFIVLSLLALIQNSEWLLGVHHKVIPAFTSSTAE